MLAPLIEAQVPFSATFGNHDNQANISHIEELRHIQRIAPLAYIKACDACGGHGGEANYFVPIFANPGGTCTSCLSAINSDYASLISLSSRAVATLMVLRFTRRDKSWARFRGSSRLGGRKCCGLAYYSLEIHGYSLD